MKKQLITGLALAMVAGNMAVQGAITHRYSFDSDASDSVGTAHGVLHGDASVVGGVASLAGGAAGGYIDLPAADIAINTYSSLTLEVWATPKSQGSYHTLLMFGQTNTVNSGWLENYFFLQTHRGDNISRAAVSCVVSNSPWQVEDYVNGPEVSNAEIYYAITISDGTNMSYYVDGQYMGSRILGTANPGNLLSNVSTEMARLGFGYPSDQKWGGTIDEYRIRNNALPAGEIGFNAMLGPDDISGDPGSFLGADVLIGTTNIVVDTTGKASLERYYTKGTNVLESSPNLTWISLDPNILTISQSGIFTGVGEGTGRVGAIFDGVTNNSPLITVTQVVKPINLVHHWDLEEGSGTNVLDRVGDAHGYVINTNHAWVAGGIDLFGGGKSGDYNATLGTGTNTVGSFIDLPNGLLTALSNAATFEATYIVDQASVNWMRVWDMGRNSAGENLAGTGLKYVALTPRNSNNQQIRGFVKDGSAEFLKMDGGPPVAGVLTHVVMTYDSDAMVSKFYVNGVLKNTTAMTTQMHLSSFAGLDVNNWLGRAQWNDPMFDGKIFDFRIYNGIMTSDEAAARYQEELHSGSPTVDPEIQSITVHGGMVTLSWTAEDLGSYSILRKTNLADVTWSTVASNLPSGNYSTNVTASGASQEFYQIKGE